MINFKDKHKNNFSIYIVYNTESIIKDEMNRLDIVRDDFNTINRYFDNGKIIWDQTWHDQTMESPELRKFCDQYIEKIWKMKSFI